MTTQARGCSALHAHAAAPLERGQYKKGQEWVDQILKTPKETSYGSV